MNRKTIFKVVATIAITAPIIWGYALDQETRTAQMQKAFERGCYPHQITDYLTKELGLKSNVLPGPERDSKLEVSPEELRDLVDAYKKSAVSQAQDEEIKDYRHKIPVNSPNKTEVDFNGKPTFQICRPAQLRYNLDHRYFSEVLTDLYSDPLQELTHWTTNNLFTLFGLIWSGVLLAGFLSYNRLMVPVSNIWRRVLGRPHE